MFHFVRLTLRLAVFLVVTIFVWAWMAKMTGHEIFSETIGEKIKNRFSADEIELRGVSRDGNKFTIHRLAMIDEEGSFFRGLELSNLICQRDFFVDFGKTWRPGIVEISRVNVSLRAGADSDEAAHAIGDVLFQDFGNAKPDAIHVANMSMRWGFTERSRGSITASKMKAVPVADGWRLNFRGGTFSQSWLEKLQIEELDVVITRKGIRFDKAVFNEKGGTLVLDGFEIEAGQRPLVSGRMKMKGMDISGMLPMVARAYVEGKISGEFAVSGSTNTTEGIGFDGIVNMEEGDVITLRDRIPLLRALTVVDSGRNYRRVDFSTGSFRMEISGDGMRLSDVKLFADDTMSLTGNMFVRKPKSDEELVLDDGSEFFVGIARVEELSEEVDISLREAGEVTNYNDSGLLDEEDSSVFGKLAVLRQNRRMREYEAEKLSQSYRYEGELQITLMHTAFDRAPALKEAYPAPAVAERIPMIVPIRGVLYEVTEDLANEIYAKGKR